MKKAVNPKAAIKNPRKLRAVHKPLPADDDHIEEDMNRIKAHLDQVANLMTGLHHRKNTVMFGIALDDKGVYRVGNFTRTINYA